MVFGGVVATALGALAPGSRPSATRHHALTHSAWAGSTASPDFALVTRLAGRIRRYSQERCLRPTFHFTFAEYTRDMVAYGLFAPSKAGGGLSIVRHPPGEFA